MKEQRFFYCPEPLRGELPEEEARHALRVLRMTVGDELWLMDGCGHFSRAVITVATGHRCLFSIEETLQQQPEWRGHIHLAMAPTKNMDRTEWMAEKATEIGLDELTLLDCRFSERRSVKTDRIDKILVAAMKQSHKAWKPVLHDMQAFKQFVGRADLPPQRFIAHCYDMADVGGGAKPYLLDALMALPAQAASSLPSHTESSQPAQTEMPNIETAAAEVAAPSMLVLVGPEGDFSVDEVRLAHQAGFRSVSLGTSRLRTETAALVAVHLMRIAASQSH